MPKNHHRFRLCTQRLVISNELNGRTKQVLATQQQQQQQQQQH